MAGVLWLTLAVAGCPLREKEIRITDNGVSWLLSACPRSSSGFPPPGGGGGGPGGSGPGGGGPGGPGGFGGSFPPPNDPGGAFCLLEDRYTASFNGAPIEARLFLVSPVNLESPEKGQIQDASKCMTLHPCGDGGRGGPSSACIAADLNQQLDGAMPNGLGFDGLKNPEDAQLILAFYQPADVSDQGGGCNRSELFACAGLAAPLGGGAYDISCASCQGGSRTAPGNDNGPCPKGPPMTNSCFLKICDGLLMNNGFE